MIKWHTIHYTLYTDDGHYTLYTDNGHYHYTLPSSPAVPAIMAVSSSALAPVYPKGSDIREGENIEICCGAGPKSFSSSSSCALRALYFCKS